MGALGLQVENLHHAFPSEDMVITAHPFIETKREKQTPKIRKRDAGVCRPAKDNLHQPVPVHCKGLSMAAEPKYICT